LHDWEIFEGIGERVAKRLGQPSPPFPRPEQIVDLGLRAGPYGAMRKHPLNLSLDTLKAHPHGVDLGPLRPSLPQRLFHQDKRIRCAPPELLAELTRFGAELSAAPDAELRLIGRRHLRSNNSWMHNSARLVKGPARHQLLMHPRDLQARGLADGAEVRVRSRAGEVVVEVASTDEVMPGVVSLPHGWGHHRPGVRLGVAQAHAGASNNDLTDETWLDQVSGNAALNGVPVTVEAA
jgi:anaerobic selenocysteine-containing dehydrogenase